MKESNKTIYEILVEIRDDVTKSYFFPGGKEELAEVCHQIELIVYLNGGKLPKKFKIYCSTGTLLYKVKEFVQQMNYEVKSVLIGKREKEEERLPFEVTLK